MRLGRTFATVSPSGMWNKEDLIGGKVKIKSGPVDAEEIYTIENIVFSLSDDGKCVTLIKIKELGKMFYWDNLIILKTGNNEKTD